MVGLINEIISRLKEIPELKLVTVWNNQFNYMNEGEIYSFPMPCAFIEIGADNFEQLSGKYQSTTLDVIIHLGYDYYNGANIDENLAIFALRDSVVRKLSLHKFTNTGEMIKKSEKQDFNHSNIYHYEIGFSLYYVDETAVVADIFHIIPTLEIQKP